MQRPPNTSQPQRSLAPLRASSRLLLSVLASARYMRRYAQQDMANGRTDSQPGRQARRQTNGNKTSHGIGPLFSMHWAAAIDGHVASAAVYSKGKGALRNPAVVPRPGASCME